MNRTRSYLESDLSKSITRWMKEGSLKDDTKIFSGEKGYPLSGFLFKLPSNYRSVLHNKLNQTLDKKSCHFISSSVRLHYRAHWKGLSYLHSPFMRSCEHWRQRWQYLYIIKAPWSCRFCSSGPLSRAINANRRIIFNCFAI